MKPKKLKTLVTVWESEPGEQKLVIAGTKDETREMAEGHMGEGRLIGVEEWWSDKRLKSLPEYEG